jgi:hypothetical protein
VNEIRGRLIPVHVTIDGDWLTWDPWTDLALVEAPAPLDDDLDEFAALARPTTARAWRALVLSEAAKWGPLSWCSICQRPHALDWRMTSPRRSGRMRERLADWQATAEHVNALRRLMHRLRGAAAGRPDDWSTVWPDRPGGLARGPDPDLMTEDGLERATAPWGDIGWERGMIAGHLTSWLTACHVGRGLVRWPPDGEPTVLPSSGSWLGELGGLLVRSLEDPSTRIRSCEGEVRGRPCRITWTVVHDKPREAPMLCTGCYALYRQRQTQSKREGQRS